jgi:hypothetical protein
MKTVGQITTIPTGTYCKITLESGEKIVISHETGAEGLRSGRLTVERLKLLGFSSDTIVLIDLGTTEGQATVARLVDEAAPGVFGSLLRRFVDYLDGCQSTPDIVARFRQLQEPRAR